MNYGIIDLGSNTVRLVIYLVNNQTFEKVFEKKHPLGILNYIENGKLSTKGYKQLKNVLSDLYQHIQLIPCNDYFCFATASFRFLSNAQEITQLILKEVGMKITPISDEEEAYYDFISLRDIAKSSHYIGCDIGGGSAQIIGCTHATLSNSVSFPIGSLRMYKGYVSQSFPTCTEGIHLTEYVRSCCQGYDFITKNTFSTLYLLGGTARAIGKLHRHIHDCSSKLHGYTLTPEDLSLLMTYLEQLGPQKIKLLQSLVPDRTFTLIPGLITLYALTKILNIQHIIISKQTIREGVLIEHFMRGKYNVTKKI